MLRDVSHGAALAQAMALAGWRAIFIGMAVFAGVLLAAAVVWFSETKPAPDRDALRPLAVLSIPLLAGSLLSWAVTMLGVTGLVLLASMRYRPAYRL